MSGGFVLCEYSAVKKEFPQFQEMLESLEANLIAKATDKWDPLTYGGIKPQAGQFGKSTIMPELFNSMGAVTLATWNQWLTATGHRTIMTGSGSGNSINEDYMIGLGGLVFLDKAIRISEIKMQISDRKLPRMNIEEAYAYEKPAIVFENGLLLDEETGFELYAFVTCTGPQRIKLLGLQLNRVPNKLQVSNVGAALV